MKRLIPLCFLVMAGGILSLAQQGCGPITVYYVQPTPIPYPNDFRVNQRCQKQENRIAGAVQAGTLDPWTGQGLAGNDEYIRVSSRNFRQQNGPDQDLTLGQAGFLNRMLDDNDLSINDALVNRDAWANSFQFQGEPPDDYYQTYNQRVQLITNIQYNLSLQTNSIDQGLQSGQLSQEDATLLKKRISAVHQKEAGYFHRHGRMDLDRDQIHELWQGMKKISRDVDHGRRRGGWDGRGANSNSTWNQPNNNNLPTSNNGVFTHPVQQNTPPNNNSGNLGAGTNHNFNHPLGGRNRPVMATPISHPVAQATPSTSFHQETPMPTATPRPAASLPTATPHAITNLQPTPPPMKYQSTTSLDERLKQLEDAAQKLDAGNSDDGNPSPILNRIQNIRREETQALKQNGGNGLTTDQFNRLSQQADSVQKMIDDRQNPDQGSKQDSGGDNRPRHGRNFKDDSQNKSQQESNHDSQPNSDQNPNDDSSHRPHLKSDN